MWREESDPQLGTGGSLLWELEGLPEQAHGIRYRIGGALSYIAVAQPQAD